MKKQFILLFKTQSNYLIAEIKKILTIDDVEIQNCIRYWKAFGINFHIKDLEIFLDPSLKKQISFMNQWLAENIIFLPKCHSTNTFAKEWISDASDHGTLILTDHQTQGRGRFDRDWYSPKKKALTFSVIFKQKNDRTPFLYMMATVLAMDLLLQKMGTGSMMPIIKWPNDILINQKKICGILCEMVTIKHNPFLIIGIGLNVNLTQDMLPPTIQSMATSMKIVYQQNFHRFHLLKKFIILWQNQLDLLFTNTNKIIDQWKKRVNLVGKEIEIRDIHGSFKGKVLKIQDDGSMILRNKEEQRIIYSGDLSFS